MIYDKDITVEFGILSESDLELACSMKDFHERFQKYECISIPDDLLNDWMLQADHIPTFWHNIHNPQHGIEHYAITLYPPSSLPALIQITSSREEEEMIALTALLKKGLAENKYAISYGI